ncbi:oxalate/formate MFS antiporter [Bradyrhizobium canariense]|uniref:MFS transporter, OFA family, oxalate/formate antiporter n=1 Tax=Bradyrhizobium canariense TaxID=255045 RepID=A0A1H1PFK4_9BRAD|nr:oxalate/formate MFS antiporter [Bradyrhizobium canariense]SDS10056.1 MFS transporter, OFA family, oxalate/formate antiporter [Bradyrhizobium canariense]
MAEEATDQVALPLEQAGVVPAVQTPGDRQRWGMLAAGVVVMILLSNYQYCFTLFTPGMKAQFSGVPYSAIALIFSIFVLFETWPVPLAGALIDRFGIRQLMLAGSVLVGAGWIGGGLTATSVFQLYIWYGLIAGLGCGIIYVAVVGNAIRWFPDKRGLAAGITAAGFGGGSALTPIPISLTIQSIGWGNAMALWGAVQGAVIFLLALYLHAPEAAWRPAGWDPATTRVVQTSIDYTWSQTLRMPEFYLLYVIHFLISLGGLMTLGNLSEIARSLHVENSTIFGISIVAFAATANGISSTISRVIWGSVSDQAGRENTMMIVFLVEAACIFAVTQIAGSPVLFVVIFPLVFFGYGQLNTLLSATTGDLFGSRYASTNFGMVYTGKGAAAFFSGWGAAAVAAAFAGSFVAPYYIAAACDVLAAALAFFALKPIARNTLANAARREAIGH